MSHSELRLKTKISYGMGDTGFAMVGVMLSMVLAVFLTDVAGIRPAYVAIIIFIGRTWDYVNDPIIGFILRAAVGPARSIRTAAGSYQNLT